LAFGVLLAHLFHFRRDRFEKLASRPAVLLPAGAALVGMGLIPGRESTWASPIAPILIYLGYGMILVALLGLPVDRGVSGRLFGSPPARLLAFVGSYSYSIYLWHIDISYRVVDALIRAGALADAAPSARWPILMASYVLLAVGSGVLFGRCIEMPALALRDRIMPRHDAPRPGTSTGPRMAELTPRLGMAPVGYEEA
jgi:peptidoglycan/LPS O-acetylase OafA/YrhL